MRRLPLLLALTAGAVALHGQDTPSSAANVATGVAGKAAAIRPDGKTDAKSGAT